VRGASRLLRGGSWLNVSTGHFRCAYRYDLKPDLRDYNYGFRCARTVF